MLRVRAGKHRRLVGRDQFADRVRIALNAGLAKQFATSATHAVHAFGNAFVHADSSILMRPIQGGIEMRENPQQPLYGLPAAVVHLMVPHCAGIYRWRCGETRSSLIDNAKASLEEAIVAFPPWQSPALHTVRFDGPGDGAESD